MEVRAQQMMLGGDVSFAEQLTELGATYFEAGTADDPLSILARNGMNTARVRLWHSPADGRSDLPEVLKLAKRIQAHELDLFLDFHYSDTWADPGTQTKPAAWQGLSFEFLKDSVRTYSEAVMAALKAQETLPAVVQIGNEIIGGMLWDDGRVGGAFDGAANWQRLAELIQAGIDGIRAPLTEAEREDLAIMIHIDRGGSWGGTKWFFDNLFAQGVDFDLIGLSYYPWWHGNLSALRTTLQNTASSYGKPIVIAETAYPWTLQWYDNTHNFVGEAGQLLSGYPATPEGQQAFLRTLLDELAALPDGLGQGLVYWAPDWIAQTGLGTPWENLALFDQNGTVLPAASAFSEVVASSVDQPGRVAQTEVALWPNPNAGAISLAFQLTVQQAVTVRVFDILGRQVLGPIALPVQVEGTQQIALDTSVLSRGSYFYQLVGEQGFAASGSFVVR